MGLRNTLVIQHLCHGLKYRLQEFFLRSGLKLDLDLTPSRKQITVSDRDCNSEGGELIWHKLDWVWTVSRWADADYEPRSQVACSSTAAGSLAAALSSQWKLAHRISSGQAAAVEGVCVVQIQPLTLQPPSYSLSRVILTFDTIFCINVPSLCIQYTEEIKSWWNPILGGETLCNTNWMLFQSLGRVCI